MSLTLRVICYNSLRIILFIDNIYEFLELNEINLSKKGN